MLTSAHIPYATARQAKSRRGKQIHHAAQRPEDHPFPQQDDRRRSLRVQNRGTRTQRGIRRRDRRRILRSDHRRLRRLVFRREDSRLGLTPRKNLQPGFWDGYYLGQRLGEWSAKYGSSATRTKFYSSKATRYFPKLGVGEFLLENGTLSVGDEVVLTGPTTGALVFTVEELRLDLEPVQTVSKGDRFSMPVPAKIRPADRLYRWHTNP